MASAKMETRSYISGHESTWNITQKRKWTGFRQRIFPPDGVSASEGFFHLKTGCLLSGNQPFPKDLFNPIQLRSDTELHDMINCSIGEA
ncbi:hypothetical protein EGM51_12015 [Verrucomicrobia bacterium S94]|nr:hypothetical protein EGM51_12015 [Verrucomicrobia bacterium S94]